jgi:hypothetical protein
VVDATMDGLAWVRKQVEQGDTDLLRDGEALLRAGDGRGGGRDLRRPPTASARMNAPTSLFLRSVKLVIVRATRLGLVPRKLIDVVARLHVSQ